MRLSTAVTLALVALLATAALGAVAATPSEPAGGPAVTTDQPVTVLEQSPTHSTAEPATPTDSREERQYAQANNVSDQSYGQPAETTQIVRINVSDDGDAHWSFEQRFHLEDEDEVESFVDYATAVTADQRDSGIDIPTQQFRQQASEASNDTEREMSIVGAGWDEYDIEPYDEDIDTQDEPDGEYEDERVGVISYTFTWTNFAAVDGDRIRIGEALQTDTTDGPMLSTLPSDHRLVIESPDGYGLETPTQLTWDGYHEFSEDEFEIVFLRGAQTGGMLSGVSVPMIVALLGALGVLAAGGYLAYRYSRDGEIPVPVPERVLDLEPGGTTGDSQPGSETVAGAAVDERSSEPAGGARRADGTQFEFSERANDDVDPELLSDEERVQRMLAQNGGRMKQAAIVTETGWSNAKVSQLLSQMDDDEQIEKLRIGRENLITLPEVDPTEVD